jgi:hypothetical protein
MNIDGFTYLTDGKFAGRYHGSVDGLHSGTDIRVLCVLTNERLSLPMMHWSEISKEEAEVIMIGYLRDKESKERIARGRVKRLEKIQQESGLKVQGFNRREDALMACVVIEYVSGKQPKIILPMVDGDQIENYHYDEELQANGQWIVISDIYLQIAFVILMQELAPPKIEPWWWNDLELEEIEAQYIDPFPKDYLKLVDSARLHGIIRYAGGEIKRGLPQSNVSLYWDVIENNFLVWREEG